LLFDIGLEAKDTVPTFIEVLENKDEDREVHSAILVALGRIGGEAKDAVPTLVKFLEPDLAKYPIQGLVAWSLGKIGTKKAVLPLIRVLENRVLENNCPDRTVAVRAILALGKIGSEAAQAVPVLKQISNDEELRRPHVIPASVVGSNFYIVTEEEEAMLLSRRFVQRMIHIYQLAKPQKRLSSRYWARRTNKSILWTTALARSHFWETARGDRIITEVTGAIAL
jgi:HEAT repeat protein